MSPARFTLTVVLVAASVFSLTSAANADGLKSQWKTRIPQATGLTQVKKSMWHPLFPEAKVLKTQGKDEAVPRLYVQRKGRLQSRVVKKVTQLTHEKSTTEVFAPAFGETDKIRSIRKMIKPANSCGLLHTHEKARCLRDLTYRKTNQYSAHIAKEAPTHMIVGAR